MNTKIWLKEIGTFFFGSDNMCGICCFIAQILVRVCFMRAYMGNGNRVLNMIFYWLTLSLIKKVIMMGLFQWAKKKENEKKIEIDCSSSTEFQFILWQCSCHILNDTRFFFCLYKDLYILFLLILYMHNTKSQITFPEMTHSESQ